MCFMFVCMPGEKRIMKYDYDLADWLYLLYNIPWVLDVISPLTQCILG